MNRLFTILLLLVLGVDLHAKVYVVSVGIADYPGTKNDLRISDVDAQTIARIYEKNGNAEAKTIVNNQATSANVLATMRTTFNMAKEEDAVILYFSGHGTSGALACFDGLLPYKDVLSLFKAIRASKKIIIADACYTGKMRTSNQHATTYSKENVMMFLSSRNNERSQETKFRNSLFTMFLERGLRGGADNNKDRQITAKELYDFVHDGVSKASGGKQHPVMWGKFDSNMTIINW